MLGVSVFSVPQSFLYAISKGHSLIIRGKPTLIGNGYFFCRGKLLDLPFLPKSEIRNNAEKGDGQLIQIFRAVRGIGIKEKRIAWF